MTVWFYCPPLEVGVGYDAGASCLGMSGAIGFFNVGWILLLSHF